MIEWVVGSTIVGLVCGIVCLVAVKITCREPPICDSCKYLIRKGDGYYEYSCSDGGHYCFSSHDFNKPPEYCKHYKPREECEEVNRNDC